MFKVVPRRGTCALLALSFEHLLAWIAEIQKVYAKDTDLDYIKDYIKKGAKEE